MPDYGHDIEFGCFLIPDASDSEAVLETARLTDRDRPPARRSSTPFWLWARICSSTSTTRR
jgi:hypothetical protein